MNSQTRAMVVGAIAEFLLLGASATCLDGLYATGDAILVRTNDCWQVTNRTKDWQSAEFNAAYRMKPGAKAHFSARLRQHDATKASFCLSVKVMDDTGTHYETIAEGQGERNGWCSLSGTYTLPATTAALYPFLMRTDSLGDYEIGDIRFTCEGVAEHRPAPFTPQLKNAFRALGMTCGACVGDAVAVDSTGCAKELLARHFNILSPENQLKAKFLLRRNGTVDFSAARPWLDFAKTNGMRVAAQALVWSELTPDWFFHEDYDLSRALVSSETMKRRLSDYIGAVLDGIEREWPGLVASWVIVNEAVGGEGKPEMEENLFLKILGPAYVAFAFECAARHRPKTDCRFLYGDCELAEKPAKIDYVLAMLKREKLIARGLVDGIGLQGHFDMAVPKTTDLRTCCDKIAATGLHAELNELDVRCTMGEAGAPLAKRYRDIFTTLLAARRNGLKLDGVTWWGLTDAYSWMTSYYNIKTYPLLFDAENRNKPCFSAVFDTLMEEGQFCVRQQQTKKGEMKP